MKKGEFLSAVQGYEPLNANETLPESEYPRALAIIKKINDLRRQRKIVVINMAESIGFSRSQVDKVLCGVRIPGLNLTLAMESFLKDLEQGVETATVTPLVDDPEAKWNALAFEQSDTFSDLLEDD